MTGSILRAVEPARDALVERLPDPPRLNLSVIRDLGREADETVDEVRGHRRRPVLGWLVGAAIVLGLTAAVAAMAMSWSRARGRHSMPDAVEGLDQMSEPGSLDGPDLGAAADMPPTRGKGTGLTAAAESALDYDPIDGRAHR